MIRTDIRVSSLRSAENDLIWNSIFDVAKSVSAWGWKAPGSAGARLTDLYEKNRFESALCCAGLPCWLLPICTALSSVGVLVGKFDAAIPLRDGMLVEQVCMLNFGLIF